MYILIEDNFDDLISASERNSNINRIEIKNYTGFGCGNRVGLFYFESGAIIGLAERADCSNIHVIAVYRYSRQELSAEEARSAINEFYRMITEIGITVLREPQEVVREPAIAGEND